MCYRYRTGVLSDIKEHKVTQLCYPYCAYIEESSTIFMPWRYTSVASFTKEVHQRLAKRPLVFIGRLANRWLTSLVKEATGVQDGWVPDWRATAASSGVIFLGCYDKHGEGCYPVSHIKRFHMSVKIFKMPKIPKMSLRYRHHSARLLFAIA